MKKKLLSYLLILCLFAALLPSLALSARAEWSTDYVLSGLSDAEKLVAVAMAQEGKRRSDLGYKHAWCADFIRDCANKAGVEYAVGSNGGYAYQVRDYVKSHGGTKVEYADAQLGDIVTVDWSKGTGVDHVEIVYKVEDGVVYTVSGNYTKPYKDGQAHIRTKSESTYLKPYISGIYRPAYKDSVKAGTPEVSRVYVSGSTVRVFWTLAENAASYDVYLVRSPWAWSDIMYSASVGNSFPIDEGEALFSNVASGSYAAFVIARPNDDTVQSNWSYFDVTVTVPTDPIPLHVKDYDGEFLDAYGDAIEWGAVFFGFDLNETLFDSFELEVFRSETENGNYALYQTFGGLSSLNGTGWGIRDPGWYYAQARLDFNGVTVESEPSTHFRVVVPSEPAVHAEATDGRITLSWNGFENGAKRYYISMENLDTGFMTEQAELERGVSVYTREDLPAGRWRITVTAYYSYSTERVTTVDLTMEESVSVLLDQSSLELNAGDAAMLIASVFPASGQEGAILWSSSDNAVAAVSDGWVIGISAGSAVITAQVGNAAAECLVTVTQDTVPEVHFQRQTLYFPGQFSDVPADQWYTDPVASAFELSLMKGTGDHTFDPYGNVTLAQAITMAARIHSIYTTGKESFVQTGTWYQVYLDYAYENGIISYACYNADVNNNATRAMFAEIFARALPDDGLYPINSISDDAIPDVKMSAGYAQHVYKLYRAGILTGGDAMGTFSPNTCITRAEAAAIVSRMAESSSRKEFSLNR